VRSQILLAAVSVMLNSTAARAEWMPVGTDSDGSVWLMDPDRISDSGNRVHAWVKIDASNDRTVKYRDGKRLYSSICSEKKLKLLSATDYDSYGKVLDSNSNSDSPYSDYGYQYVTPDSMGETVLELSCAVSKARN